MSQVHADPDELDLFAQSLARFIENLNEAVNGLRQSFSVLEETWQDATKNRFEENLNLLLRQFSQFEANTEEFIPYLRSKASSLREYQ